MKYSFPTLRPAALVAIGLLACLSPCRAEEAEDLVILSPFEIESTSTGSMKYAGQPVQDATSTQTMPRSPVSIIKRAESLAVQFVLMNNESDPVRRNKELDECIAAISKAVAAQAGMSMEQREIRFASAQSKFTSFSFGRSNSNERSFANLVIFSELPQGNPLSLKMKQIRELLDRAIKAGNTKLKDGFVGLSIKNPNQYRREILSKFFEDLEFVKKGLGPDFELLPNGLDNRVSMRACSEFDIELWIPSGYTIRSLRELQAKSVLEH
jgi:hypothetical protein